MSAKMYRLAPSVDDGYWVQSTKDMRNWLSEHYAKDEEEGRRMIAQLSRPIIMINPEVDADAQR